MKEGNGAGARARLRARYAGWLAGRPFRLILEVAQW
jgi:hypothetical protein